MALAETAHLVVALDLKNGLRQGSSEAIGQVTGIERAASRAALPMGRLTSVTEGAGRAMDHFRGRVRGAVQVMGTVGLLGGVAAIASYAKSAVDAAESWADTTRQIHAITGMSVQDASRFADALDALGVGAEKQVRILGFMSKTLGTLSINQKAARKVQEDYGFSLLDSRGRMRSSMDVLMGFTEYFNDKTIPAQHKAALGAKLFGRGWTDLIPILEQGPKRVREAMSGAMTMTDSQMRTMNRWRDEQRELNDALGDLSVKIGMAIVPALTDLARSVTGFVSEHEQDVLRFFEGLVQGGRDLASLLTGTVIPTLSNLGTGAANLWNDIPGPLRDLLVKGFVADRTIKFLFGVSMTDVLKGGLKGLLGGGGLFQRGTSPTSPLFVRDVAGGLGGAAGVGAAGGLGRLGKGILAVEVVGMAAAVWDAWQTHIVDAVHRNQESNRSAAEGIVGEGLAKATTDLANMSRLLREVQGADRVVVDTTSAGEIGLALRNAADEVARGARTAGELSAGIRSLEEARQQATEHGWTEVATYIGARIDQLRHKTPTARQIGDEVGKAGAGGPSKAERREAIRIGEVIGHLRQVKDDGKGRDYGFDRASQRSARMLVRALGTTGRDRDKVVRETIDRLKDEQRRAEAAGATRLARNLGRDITTLQRTLGHKQDTTNSRLGTISRKDTSVQVTVPVTTSVSVRDVVQRTTTMTRYGMTAV